MCLINFRNPSFEFFLRVCERSTCGSVFWFLCKNWTQFRTVTKIGYFPIRLTVLKWYSLLAILLCRELFSRLRKRRHVHRSRNLSVYRRIRRANVSQKVSECIVVIVNLIFRPYWKNLKERLPRLAFSCGIREIIQKVNWWAHLQTRFFETMK